MGNNRDSVYVCYIRGCYSMGIPLLSTTQTPPRTIKLVCVMCHRTANNNTKANPRIASHHSFKCTLLFRRKATHQFKFNAILRLRRRRMRRRGSTAARQNSHRVLQTATVTKCKSLSRTNGVIISRFCYSLFRACSMPVYTESH